MEFEEPPEIECDETPCHWEIGSFVDMPVSLRLQYCEILIYMSDYVQAEFVLDQLLEDFKYDFDANCIRLKAPELLKFVSVVMYLLPKLKRIEDTIHFA